MLILDTKKGLKSVVCVHFQKLYKDLENKLKISRKKGIIEIRAENNEIGKQSTKPKVSSFDQKISKTDKPQTRLIKEEREWTQLIVSEMKVGLLLQIV